MKGTLTSTERPIELEENSFKLQVAYDFVKILKLRHNDPAYEQFK
jgi:hypothetical protein